MLDIGCDHFLHLDESIIQGCLTVDQASHAKTSDDGAEATAIRGNGAKKLQTSACNINCVQ